MPFNRWLGVAMVICLTVGIGVNIGLWLRPVVQQPVTCVSYKFIDIAACETNQNFTGQTCPTPFVAGAINHLKIGVVEEYCIVKQTQPSIYLNTCPVLWTHEMILLLDSITAQTGIRFSCLVPQK